MLKGRPYSSKYHFLIHSHFCLFLLYIVSIIIICGSILDRIKTLNSNQNYVKILFVIIFLLNLIVMEFFK